MGYIARAIDKLPFWVRLILGVLTIVGSVWCIAREGLLTFIVKVIFSPDL